MLLRVVGLSIVKQLCKIIPASSFVRYAATAVAHQPQPNPQPNLAPQPLFHERSHPISKPPFPTLDPQLSTALDALLMGSANDANLLSKVRASPMLHASLCNRENARHIAEALAPQSPRRSHRILVLAHQLGCRFNQNAYESVCFHLSRGRHWLAILSTVTLGRKHTGRTSIRLLNWQTRALVETGRYSLLDGVSEEFKAANLRPTRRTYEILLSGHIRNHDLARTKECIQAMQDDGYPVGDSTHITVARNYRAFGTDIRVHHRALDTLPGIDPAVATSVVNSLLRIRIDAKDLDGALKLLSLFDRRMVDIIPGLLIHRSTPPLRSLPPTPVSSLALVPNAATFAIFLNVLANRGDLPGTLEIFAKMLSLKILPTTETIAALMQAHFSAGQGEVAVHMVSQMCGNRGGKAPTFQGLRSAPTTHPLPLSLEGMVPTVLIFNTLLRGVIHTDGLDAVDIVLPVMVTHGVKPNTITLEILLSHLADAHHAPPQLLLRTLRKLSAPHLRPTIRHLHIILKSILRYEKCHASGIGWNSRAMKYSPWKIRAPSILGRSRRVVIPTFDPVAGLEPSGQSSSRSLLQPILQSLNSRNVKSDAATFSLRMRHEAVVNSDAGAAKAIFDTLLLRGIHPNEYHFSALMEAYARTGDLRAAKDVMAAAENAGVKANVVMYTILIDGYGRQGSPDLALRTFQHMVEAGLRPDIPAVDAITSAFYTVGAPAQAKRILTTLWAYIQPFPKDLRGATLKTLAHRFRQLHDASHTPKPGPTQRQLILLRRRLGHLAATWDKLHDRRRQDPNSIHTI